MELFRSRQRLHYSQWLRFATEVTVDGAINPLPDPYKTKYRVHQVGRNYWVEVLHPPTSLRCQLQDGEVVPQKEVENAGAILCARL